MPDGPRSERARASAWLAYLALALVVLALVVPPTFVLVRQEVLTQRNLVTTVASLQAQLLERWFEELLASAHLLAVSEPFAEPYLRWVEEGDESARRTVLTRTAQYLRSSGFSQALLLDGQREVVGRSEGLDYHDPVPNELREVWPEGAEPGETLYLPPYRDERGRVHIDVVGALAVPPGTTPPLVVSHADPEDLIDHAFVLWPTPSGSGRVLAFVALADGALLFEPGPDELAHSLLGWDEAASGITREVVQAAPEPVFVRAPDHRGVEVLAAGASVGDTGWFVLAQLDRAEAYAGATTVVLMAGLLALTALGLGLVVLGWLRQRKRLLDAERERAVEAERSRGAGLLRAILDSSPDVIFAKDLEGHYLVFNRAAGEAFGSDPQEVIGQPAGSLFSAEHAKRLDDDEARVIAEDRPISFEDVVETSHGERVFMATKGPLRDETGNVFGVFGISRDITERRRAERALEDQSHELERNVEDLERFNRAMVGRELAIVELKRKVNELSERAGLAPPHDLSSLEPQAEGDDG